MKCTRCGKELDPGQDFCSYCGARRTSMPPRVARAQRPVPEPRRWPVFAAAQVEAWSLMEGFRDKWVRVGCIGLLVVACVVEALLAAWLLNLISPPRGQPVAPPEVPGGAPTGVPQPTPSELPASSASPTSPLAPTPLPTSPPAPPMVTATPSVEPAVVEPYCSALGQSPVHVRQDQPITIHWAWVATAASYVQDHLDTATVQVLLNGEEVRPETQSEIEYDSGAGMYSVTWSADVGTLAPGSHRLDYHARWSRQISDGWYTYGPGGQTEEQHEYCELVVE